MIGTATASNTGARARGDLAATGRRELVAMAVAVVAFSRLADGPVVWVIALLVAAAIALGVLQVLGDQTRDRAPDGVPVEALLTPAAAGFACVLAVRLVPVGLGLVPALLGAAWLMARTMRSETRIVLSPGGATETDRARVLVDAVLVGFVAFLGVAGFVPGGLPQPGIPGRLPMAEADLLVLAAADAGVAGVLGYRAAALRTVSLRAAAWSASTYAGAIAIAAAAVRAMDVPRLIGPALLTLVFFLWEAFVGAPSGRRDRRWIWQAVLLAALGGAVIAWNAGLR